MYLDVYNLSQELHGKNCIVTQNLQIITTITLTAKLSITEYAYK